ncbi:MAG: hypothetical protein AAAC47_24635 [Pararhizobium sp.]
MNPQRPAGPVNPARLAPDATGKELPDRTAIAKDGSTLVLGGFRRQ